MSRSLEGWHEEERTTGRAKCARQREGGKRGRGRRKREREGGGYRWREHERSKTSRGEEEGNAREKRGTRDVWTSLRRNGWVRLEQTRVRGIIRRFIRLLSRSYSALFIRPGEPAFFLPPRYLLHHLFPLITPSLSLSLHEEQLDKGRGRVGDETEIKKGEREREFRGWCGARGSWLKYTSEPRGFLLIPPPSLRLSPNTILPLFFIPLLSLSFQRRSSRQPPRRESGEPFFRSPFSNATVRVFGEFGMSWHHVNSRGTELDRAYILRISGAAVSTVDRVKSAIPA